MKRHHDDQPELLLPPHGKPPVGGIEVRMPCHLCGGATLWATLSQYGARCYGCYVAYCRTPQSGPKFVGDGRLGPTQWADALRQREQSGERLTPFQREAWRRATNPHGLPLPGDSQ